jgi:hypothetical protein
VKRVAYFRPLLWGHYHVMLGLLMWSEHTGDQRAQVAAERIADLVCQTCLGTGFRVFDAGSHEMNMAILHGLALAYDLLPAKLRVFFRRGCTDTREMEYTPLAWQSMLGGTSGGCGISMAFSTWKGVQ